MSGQKTREQLELEEASAAFDNSFKESSTQDDPNGNPDGSLPAPDPEPAHQPSTDPSQQADSQTNASGDAPPAGDEPKDYAKLKREHDSLLSRFKAIQANITKPQQINADLRRQKDAVEAELIELRSRMTPADSGSQEPSKAHNPHIDSVREVLPEVADALENYMAESQKQQKDLERRLDEQEKQRLADHANATMAELFRQRPEAQRQAADPNFWAWIDSLPEASKFREFLLEPWVGDHFPRTLAVFDAYSHIQGDLARNQGAPVPFTPAPVQTTPPIAAVPPTVQRPSDISAPMRSTTRPGIQGTASGVLSESQRQELDRELRGSGPVRAREIAEILERDWRLRARR